MILGWFFLDQAEKQRLVETLKSPALPPTNSEAAAVNAQKGSPPPDHQDRREREDDEWGDEDDGEDDRSPSTNAAAPPVQPQPQPIPPPAPVEAVYRDGVYRASSQAPWGPMTIEVTVSGGKWTAIKNLEIPDSPPSYRAVNLLVTRALQAQSAEIDGVSGATYTSDAFRDDLKQIVDLSKR